MKELDGFGNAIFDQHAPGVAGDQGRATAPPIVGEQDGRLLVAEVDDGDLPYGPLVVAQETRSSNTLGVRNARVKDGKVIRRQAEAGRLQMTPSMDRVRRRRVRKWMRRWFFHASARRWSSVNRTPVLRGAAGVLLPKVDEADDLGRLLGLGDAGPRVAECGRLASRARKVRMPC